MAIIATICLLAAGVILCMAVAKHEYSRQFLIDKQTSKSETRYCQKGGKGLLPEVVFFLLSAIVMAACAVFWVAWEFFFETALKGSIHAVFCLIWVVSSYWTGAKTGKLIARLHQKT